MKLCPKRKTDEEYIECIRKHLARSKWYGIFLFCCAFLCIVSFYGWWQQILAYRELAPGAEEEVLNGMFIGIVVGAMAGVGIMLASQGVIWGFQYLYGQRTERLLVQLHDELKQYKKNSPPPDNSQSPSHPDCTTDSETQGIPDQAR